MTIPRSPRERFAVWLSQLSRLWRTEIDRRLSPHGLTESRWLTLLHLSRLGEQVTQTELAAAVGVQGPTLVRTLDWLEAEGLIERRPLPSDRRAKSVHLTAKAEPSLQRIQKVAEQLRAEIFSDISAAEIDTCLAVFEKIAAKLGGCASGCAAGRARAELS
jgi:MarR family transcriptional regulator for hemolysin